MRLVALLDSLQRKLTGATRDPVESYLGSAPVRFTGSLPIQKLNIMFQACNLTCPMCSVNVNNTEIGQVLRDYPNAAKGPQLRLEEYKEVLGELIDHSPIVSIAGGEPTYFPYIVDLIEYARKELKYSVGLTTNGTLLTEAQLERLAACEIAITISLDGMQPMHDSIRGVGTFEKATNLLKSAVEKKKRYPNFKVYSLFCIQECNYHEVAEIARYNIEEIGVDAQTMSYYVFARADTLEEHEKWRKANGLSDIYKIDILHGGDAAKGNFAKFDFGRMYSDQTRMISKYGNKINYEPCFRSAEHLTKYFMTNEPMAEYFGRLCAPAHLAVNLLSNGDVLFYPMCFQIRLGNVRENKLLDIWNGQTMKEVRSVLSRSLSPVCAHCCANRLNKNEHLLKKVGIDVHRFIHEG
jgi:MoaA/NifB/PqqE/SkfB family radical SAM enzyme